jgi:hypothetical protein
VCERFVSRMKWLVKPESHIQGITAGSRTVFHDNTNFVRVKKICRKNYRRPKGGTGRPERTAPRPAINRSTNPACRGVPALSLQCHAKMYPEPSLSGLLLLPKGILSLHFETRFDLVTSGFDLVTPVLLLS